MTTTTSSLSNPNTATPPTTTATPPAPFSPRFTLELEFVLSLSNPDYLTWLGVSYPNLLNTLTTTTSKNNNTSNDNSDAAKFARYLAYLYKYWKTPQYSQFLTHPAATLRNLELLQQERFRRDMISLDVRERLREGFAGFDLYNTADGEAEADAANEDPEARVQHGGGENGVSVSTGEGVRNNGVES